MSDPQLDELYQQALDEAKVGNRAKARELLEQILEEDEEYVRAWLALARLSDNIDEKRICLTTVLQLDPNNRTAKNLLEKLDERLETTKVDEVLPGISRRLFRLLAGGLIGFILIVLVIIILVVSSANSRRASNARGTESAQITLTQLLLQPTLRAQEATAQSQSMTETQIAIASPTPTPTATNVYVLSLTVPPTITLTPTPTIPAPEGLTGRLFGWSGRDQLNSDHLPIVEYDLNGGAPIPLGEYLVRYPNTLDGTNFVFMNYVTSRFESDLVLWTVETDEIERLVLRWVSTENTVEPDMVHMSADGTMIVFTADSITTGTRQIYLARLNPEEGQAVIEPLTSDAAEYSFPAISPDNREVVAIRTTIEGETEVVGADIVRITIDTRRVTLLTSDGNTIVETTPRWAPDSQQIIYAWIPETTTDGSEPNYNINIVSREGTPNFEVINDPTSNDTYPVFSPDGNYIAFTSDRTTQIELFVLDLRGQRIFQLTNSPDEDYAWSWLP